MITAADLRMALAKARVYGYRVAARVHVNPIRFSRLLNGHERLSDKTASRILRAIEEEVAARDH